MDITEPDPNKPGVLDLYARIGILLDQKAYYNVRDRVIKRGPGVPNWHRDVQPDRAVRYSGAVLRVIRSVKGIGRPIPGTSQEVRDIIRTKLEAMT